MNKNIIISDKLFYKLWDTAMKSESEENFIHTLCSPLSYQKIEFEKKYGLKNSQMLKMLKEIYRKANLSFTEVMELTGKSQAELSNAFCIPKRDIQNWAYNKSRCPGYIKLMILRQYHQLDLGRGVYVESQQEFRTTAPSKNKHSDTYLTSKNRKEAEAKKQPVHAREKFLTIEEIIQKEKERQQEMQHNSNRNILEETDYLKTIMDRQKKKDQS